MFSLNRWHVVAAALSLVSSTYLAGQQVPFGSVGVGASMDVEPIVPKRINNEFVYSAKIVCGNLDVAFIARQPVVLNPGYYLTTINLRNPLPVNVRLTKQTVESRPQYLSRGRIGRPVPEALRPEESFYVDCKDANDLLGGAGIQFLEGWVVIKSQTELDVTAVYTYKNIEVWPRGLHVYPPGNHYGQPYNRPYITTPPANAVPGQTSEPEIQPHRQEPLKPQ